MANALCADLSASDAASVAALAEPISFVRGARIVRQGESSRGAWLLRSGAVEARITLPAGGEETVARIEAHQYFGETALLERGVCNASVVAVENVDGWFLERETFRALVTSRHPAALALQRTVTRTLAGRLVRLNAAMLAQPAPEDRTAKVWTRAVMGTSQAPGFTMSRFLSLLAFFQGFQSQEIEAVTTGLAMVTASRGEAIFIPGDPADACFLLVRGAVEVLAQRDGVERRMALIGPGSLLGYLSVLSASPHGAVAVARENATLLVIPAQRFTELFNGRDSAAVKTQLAIQRNLLQSLGRSNSQMSRLVTQARLDASLRVQARAVGL